MNFHTYQQLAGRTEKLLPLAGRLQHAMLGILTEAGELGDVVKRHVIYGQPLAITKEDAEQIGKEGSIEEEIGDLLWYVALAANAAGLDLSRIAEMNIEKLQRRYPEKYTDAAASVRADKK